MKRYISAVLIYVLPFQYSCSYVQRVITYDDFYILPKEQEAEIIINDESKIKLTSDSLKYNYMYWWKGQDTLTIYSTHLEKIGSTSLIKVTDTIYYPKKEITKVHIEELDESRTIIQIAITTFLIGLTIYVMNNLELEWK